MIKPMLAETAKQPFDSKDFIYELKLDGVRCIAYLDGGVKLQARSGSDITYKFPELAEIHKQVGKPCILDGEIACTDFNGIQHRIHRERALDIKFAMRQYPAIYYVFDILNLAGESVMTKPLVERKLLLGKNLTDSDVITFNPFQQGDGVKLFDKVKLLGLEGIMAKQIYSPYIEGKRSTSWLKIKTFVEDTFYICGLTKGENDRARTFGSLILADKEFNYVGCAGSGLTDQMLSYILRVIKPSDCPFNQVPKLDREVLAWVKPEQKCEIRYLGRGSEGHLRFPTFRKLVRGENEEI